MSISIYMSSYALIIISRRFLKTIVLGLSIDLPSMDVIYLGYMGKYV